MAPSTSWPSVLQDERRHEDALAYDRSMSRVEGSSTRAVPPVPLRRYREHIHKLRYLMTPREQRRASLLLMLMMGGAVLEVVGVGAIPAFLALLNRPELAAKYGVVGKLIGHGVSGGAARSLILASTVLLAIFLLKNLYLAWTSLVQVAFVKRLQTRLAFRLLRAYLYGPYELHLTRNPAELLRNANTEALEVVGSVLMPTLQLVMEALTITGLLLMLVIVEPYVSVVALVLLGGANWIFLRSMRARMLLNGQQGHYYRGKMVQTVNEGLHSIKVTRVMGREHYFLEKFRRLTEGYSNAEGFRKLMQEYPRLLLETGAVLGIFLITVLLLLQGRPPDMVIPALSLLGVAAVRLIPSFNRSTSAIAALRYGRFALDALYADLSTIEPVAMEPAVQGSWSGLAREIQLDHVSYSYPQSPDSAITDVSLTIRRGTAVAFVGPTGSGKTTLVDLILGLLAPSAGAIRIDGIDLATSRRGWQNAIGYVPQDVYLTDDTIRRNVALGYDDADIDEKAVSGALDAAQLSTFVSTLPNGAETIVGERGVRLSGGQRQRIGIARALYHNPEVLVLDEATSALDYETERFIVEAVQRLRGERTIIMITHRISTLSGCDEIFVLRDGRIVESAVDTTVARDGMSDRTATADVSVI